MVEVFFTVQTLKRGLPVGSTVKRFKDVKYGTRSQALNRVMEDFYSFTKANPEHPISKQVSHLYGMLGSISKDDRIKGVANIINNSLLTVTLVEEEDAVS